MPDEKVQATKLIQDLKPTLVDYVTEHLKEKIKRGATPAGRYAGLPYYAFGDRGVGYVTLVNRNDQVVYFVRHRLVRHKLRLGRQVLVWRNRQDLSSPGFAQFVFFNVLLPKYKALIADQEQTTSGFQFWQYALLRAFNEHLYVYALDRKSNPNRLIRLRSHEDLIEKEDLLWGHTNAHLRTFAVISKVPLKINS